MRLHCVQCSREYSIVRLQLRPDQHGWRCSSERDPRHAAARGRPVRRRNSFSSAMLPDPGLIEKFFRRCSTYDINVKAHYYTTQAFLPRMIEEGHGHVIVSSRFTVQTSSILNLFRRRSLRRRRTTRPQRASPVRTALAHPPRTQLTPLPQTAPRKPPPFLSTKASPKSYAISTSPRRTPAQSAPRSSALPTSSRTCSLASRAAFPSSLRRVWS